MSEFTYICPHHRNWVSHNPRAAFAKVQQMQEVAEVLIAKEQFRQAIPFLGTALETAELIFDNRLESPQLTSLSIMLAHAYEATQHANFAKSLLQRIALKMAGAIECGKGYETKIAFYQHCIKAIEEANASLFHAKLMPNAQPYSLLH